MIFHFRVSSGDTCSAVVLCHKIFMLFDRNNSYLKMSMPAYLIQAILHEAGHYDPIGAH